VSLPQKSSQERCDRQFYASLAAAFPRLVKKFMLLLLLVMLGSNSHASLSICAEKHAKLAAIFQFQSTVKLLLVAL